MRFDKRSLADRVEIVFDDGGMNLLSSSALADLAALIESAEVMSAPLLVFSSGRPGLFAAGADMTEMRDFSPADAERFAATGQDLFDRIEKLPAITVAIIDGDCFGGALDLALSFDLRFATPRARFAHPGARIGIVTGFGGTTRWRKVLQRPAAQAMFIGNRVLSPAEAERSGLVDAVADEFSDRLSALAKADPRAVRLVKELTAHAASLTRPQLQLLAKRLGHLYFGPGSGL
jgi:enoyl-CoA hydratase